MPFVPMCLSITGEISSGPMAFEFLIFLMAAVTSAGLISQSKSLVIALNLRFVCLADLSCLGGWGVNCMLK